MTEGFILCPLIKHITYRGVLNKEAVMSEKRGSDVRHMGYAVAEREYRAFISVEEHVEESSGLSQATLDFFSGSMYEPIEEEIGAQNKTRVLISGTGAELTNMDIIEFFGDDHR